MTIAEQAVATTPDTNTDTRVDRQKAIRVKASSGVLFDALTDLSARSTWWTRVTGSPDDGGRLEFHFGLPQPCVMHVDQVMRSAAVHRRATKARR